MMTYKYKPEMRPPAHKGYAFDMFRVRFGTVGRPAVQIGNSAGDGAHVCSGCVCV